MSYYPIFPQVPTYLHPALNPHLHAELTAVHHGRLFRQQAQLEYLSRSNFQLQHLDRAAKYSNQVLEKQFRIAKMLEEDRARLLLERQLLEERNTQQQIRFREQMRRLDLQRQYFLIRDRPYLTERKKQIQNQSMRQTLKDPVSEANKETAKFRSVKEGQILNFKPKDYHIPHVRQQSIQQKGEISTKRKKVQSVVKDITYDDGQFHLQSSNTKRRSSILKKSQYVSPKFKKQKKQVQFINQSSSKKGNSQTESLQDTKNESYCLHNSALRAAYKSNRKKAPISSSASAVASKMIEIRLKVSSVVYRDSQFRNIKHQVQHLANTYDTECRLRRELKGNINGRDDIIKKYNIVPPESK